MKNNNLVRVLAICGSLIALGANAAEEEPGGLEYTLRVGGAYSDNVVRSPSPLEEGAGSVAFGGELRGSRPTGRFKYDVGGEIMRYEYLDYYNGGETFGRGVASGSYDFSPEHFTWNGRIDFDQFRADLFQPLAPGNAQDVVTMSTGPSLRAQLFGALDSQLDVVYERAYYEGNTVDSQTVGGDLELGRRRGPQSRYGLGASFDDVSYMGGPLVGAVLDFQRSEVFLYGHFAGARTQLSIEAGYTQAEGNTFDDDGPMGNLRLTRQMSPSLSAYLGYRHEIPTSQTAPNVSDPTVGGGGVANNSVVTSSPREAWRGEAGFTYVGPRSEGEIGFYHLDERSFIQALGDHTYDELRARVTRRFTPNSYGMIYAAYSREEFTAFAQEFDELKAGAQYAHNLTRSTALEVRIEYRDRDGDTNDSSYSEFSGGLFLTYTGSVFGRTTSALPDVQP